MGHEVVVVSIQSKTARVQIWWDKGVINLADYHIKHFPPSHHQQIRPTYILRGDNLSKDMTYVQGCVNQPSRNYHLGYTTVYKITLGMFQWTRDN